MTTIAPLQFLFLTMAGWVNRQQQDVIDYLKEENRILRGKLGTKRIRFSDGERRRLAAKGKRLGRKLLGTLPCLVTPDTILRWYRTLIASKYDGSKNRRPGRPRTKKAIRDLVITIAKSNPVWGYTRIRDALRNVGILIGRTTVQEILRDHGIEPAPERRERTPWRTFLKAHWGAICAADLFTVEVLTLRGLVRYHVLFVIDLKSRRVEIGGIHPNPHGAWMVQIARNLTDAFDGFPGDARYLILERDPLYTREFRSLLKSAGVDPVRLPARSPNLNAYAERFVLSVKSERLNRIVPLGERHLRITVREYAAHYHLERPHQGLGGRLIAPPWPTQMPAARSNAVSDSVACFASITGTLRDLRGS